MRIVCVQIDRFAAAVEVRERPELLSRPVIIGGFPNERKPVFECSAGAAGLGIALGMPLRQAHHICPDAVFVPLDRGRYDRAFDEVLEVLDGFSPVVEVDEPGRAFLDITGTERLFGTDEEAAERIGSEVLKRTGLEPRVGIGCNRFVASMAAHTASREHPAIIGKGGERESLRPLPSQMLPVSEKVRRRFDLLGLRTIGQIAALPQDALADQFGLEGVLAYRLANGEDGRPLLSRKKPVDLEQELSSESSLDTIDALMAAMDKLLDKLVPALRERNQVCGQIRLCFYLEGAKSWRESLMLKAPTDSKGEMMALLKHRLENVQFPDSITGMNLCLTHLGGEEAKQMALVSGERARREERLKRVARHLQGKFGKNQLKKVVQVDPGSRIPERRSVLTDYRP